MSLPSLRDGSEGVNFDHGNIKIIELGDGAETNNDSAKPK